MDRREFCLLPLLYYLCGRMNIYQFFRQARFLRSYEPAVSTPASTMTVTTITHDSKLLVLGRLVVWLIPAMNFTIGGVAETEIRLAPPVPCKTSLPGITGRVDDLSQMAVNGTAVAGADGNISFKRQDGAVWTAGAPRFISCVVFYESAE